MAVGNWSIVSSAGSSWEPHWKICWEKRKKSSASRLDRKYLWHMIYIIKEDKSPEFTWLVTLKSGSLNSVSHLQLLCSPCRHSPHLLNGWEKRRNKGDMNHPLLLSLLSHFRTREIKKLVCLSFTFSQCPLKASLSWWLMRLIQQPVNKEALTGISQYPVSYVEVKHLKPADMMHSVYMWMQKMLV